MSGRTRMRRLGRGGFTLAEVAMKLGQAIYEQEQAKSDDAAADAHAAAADDDVVDAEFSEVEDDKK